MLKKENTTKNININKVDEKKSKITTISPDIEFESVKEADKLIEKIKGRYNL